MVRGGKEVAIITESIEREPPDLALAVEYFARLRFRTYSTDTL